MFFSREARPTGLEPATSGSTVQCSNQLSYGPKNQLFYRNLETLKSNLVHQRVNFGRQINVSLRWDYSPTPKLCKSTPALLLSHRKFLRFRESTSAEYSFFADKNGLFTGVEWWLTSAALAWRLRFSRKILRNVHKLEPSPIL